MTKNHQFKTLAAVRTQVYIFYNPHGNQMHQALALIAKLFISQILLALTTTNHIRTRIHTRHTQIKKNRSLIILSGSAVYSSVINFDCKFVLGSSCTCRWQI
jgi:hypothetical protein